MPAKYNRTQLRWKNEQKVEEKQQREIVPVFVLLPLSSLLPSVSATATVFIWHNRCQTLGCCIKTRVCACAGSGVYVLHRSLDGAVRAHVRARTHRPIGHIPSEFLEKHPGDRGNLGCKSKCFEVWKRYFSSCFPRYLPSTCAPGKSPAEKWPVKTQLKILTGVPTADVTVLSSTTNLAFSNVRVCLPLQAVNNPAHLPSLICRGRGSNGEAGLSP